jgi:SAM-dependent methyltransferase
MGWRKAVQHRFAGNENMLVSLLDWQRASWLALLGLEENAVALDIGSGYGAITHSLASVAGEVYSLEAMTERIEFTRIRLEQEGIANVRLIQGSALNLPFPENSFDLIVVNGVLEWTGEWETNGNPRAVQRRFLKHLRGLLRDDGLLVIGIENRFGYNLFQGGLDHSNLPYTSLMPRAAASLYLRLSHRAHHRTSLNPQREYRTYTYSERGYRKLLAESDFKLATIYWADPGYNQPYSLVPMQSTRVRQYFWWKRADPSGAFRSDWRWRAKGGLAWILPFVAPDFVILAEKGTTAGRGRRNHLVKPLGREAPLIGTSAPVCMLCTCPFSPKSLIKVFESGSDTPSLVLKASTAARGSKEAVQSEFRNLSLVTRHLRMQTSAGFAVPTPLDLYEVGRLSFTAESVAAGQQLSTLIFRDERYRRPGYLRKELARCVDVALQLAKMLRGELAIKEFDLTTLTLPPEVQSEPEIQRMMKDGAHSLRFPADESWAQHGDFTIENILLERSGAPLTVIDWEHLARGVPPLSDVFSLLISVLPVVTLEGPNVGPEQRSFEPKFLEAFFGRASWAGLFRDLLLHACKESSLPTEQVWEAFVRFLILRIHHFVPISSPAMTAHSKFLVCALQRRGEFLFSVG